jgi:hypothetical protein
LQRVYEIGADVLLKAAASNGQDEHCVLRPEAAA